MKTINEVEIIINEEDDITKAFEQNKRMIERSFEKVIDVRFTKAFVKNYSDNPLYLEGAK